VNADLSVAPEIAQLAAPFVLPPRARAASAPRTDGRLAGELTRLAAAPQRWWDLVRFDADGPVRVPVPGADGAWLLILPPGGTPVRAGRVRLHAGRRTHRVRGAAHGFSVTLHSKTDFSERTVAPL